MRVRRNEEEEKRMLRFRETTRYSHVRNHRQENEWNEKDRRDARMNGERKEEMSG